jgi:hypothetical protein
MNTPSHFIMTAALRKRYRRVPIPTFAFLLGSVAPDIPLYLLSIGSAFYYRFIVGLSVERTFRHMYDTMYFENPGWIAGHNLLHAPALLLIALAVLRPYRRHLRGWQRWVFWFLVACLFHSAVDIATHVDDGPVMFFPFNWTMRFHSPVSYWDRRYYGAQFALFELALDLVLLVYLLGGRILRWIRRRLSPPHEAQPG